MLILPILLWCLLDSVVRQMDVDILQVLQWKIFATCSEISLIVPIGFKITVYYCDQHVMTDVELTVVIEKRVSYIGLHDCCLYLPVWVNLLLQKAAWDITGSHQAYSCASVGAFSRLNNPNLLLITLFFDLQKVAVGGVVCTFKMIGFGYNCEGINFLNIPIIVFHSVKQSLLRSYEAIVGNMVSDYANLICGDRLVFIFRVYFKLSKLRLYLCWFLWIEEELHVLLLYDLSCFVKFNFYSLRYTPLKWPYSRK